MGTPAFGMAPCTMSQLRRRSPSFPSTVILSLHHGEKTYPGASPKHGTCPLPAHRQKSLKVYFLPLFRLRPTNIKIGTVAPI